MTAGHIGAMIAMLMVIIGLIGLLIEPTQNDDIHED